MADMDNRLEKFNSFLNKPDTSGYLTMFAKDEFAQLNNSVPFDRQYAELRISIKPERNNLINAAEALKKDFNKYGFEWKILTISENNEANLPNASNWDGGVIDDAAFYVDSDRQQRGKEICIYIHSAFNISGDWIEYKSSDWWKEVILKSWQLLENAGIEYGYALPSRGDQPIQTEGFATPFTLTRGIEFCSKRNDKNDPLEYYRHGMLLGKPFEASNAVEEVTLTHKDLASYNLTNSLKKIGQRRVQFYNQSNRHLELLKVIKQQLSEIENSEINIFEKVSSKEELGNDEFNKINDKLPRDVQTATPKLTKSLVTSVEHFNKNKSLILTEMETIENEFTKHVSLGLLGIDNEKLYDFIGKNPAMMQLIFRKMVIIQDELSKIEDQNFNLNELPESDKVGFYKLELFSLISRLKLKDNQNSIEAKACVNLQTALVNTYQETKNQNPQDLAQEMLNTLENHSFVHENKQYNALEIASHNSSIKQILLNIVACVATLGYGLVKGLKSYHERKQFDTGIKFFKSKSDIGRVQSDIHRVANKIQEISTEEISPKEDSGPKPKK